ncbi:DUF3618 domain-containing protein [Dongia deserti]|uniref:DUF3618 domain-containing protein n=1 Tax=Dongia deserti TaxID=2268030 RepID=UPI0013C4A29C|nr:DUF3618 domain-containing protein [Dongia deserti]
MANAETARLEREAEETRAQLEQTLGELRARMSPGQLLDQATNYFRNNSGRAYLGNLRDEVVHNPVPVALIGAGIAWLAISGTMGRRRNGNGRMERDWGRTAGVADDLSHGGRGPSAMRRARETAEDWAGEARDAMSGTLESAKEMGDRASTAHDEAIGAARQTAKGWTEEASSTVHQARDRAADMYDQTASGIRRVARRAAGYGRAARRAVQSDGALVNFCREQPMLVAGLGVAVGAVLAAMIPSSRAEREIMGETSRDVQDRVREAASETMRAASGDSEGDRAGARASESASERRYGDAWQRESGQSGAARDDTARIGEDRRGEPYAAREAATDIERGVQRSDRASNVEAEPQSAPYAEAAEAGAAGTTPAREDESKQRT